MHKQQQMKLKPGFGAFNIIRLGNGSQLLEPARVHSTRKYEHKQINPIYRNKSKPSKWTQQSMSINAMMTCTQYVRTWKTWKTNSSVQSRCWYRARQTETGQTGPLA